MEKARHAITNAPAFQPLKGACDGCQRRSRWNLAVLSILFLSACASTNPITIDPAPYAGPAIRFEQSERTHTAVFTMPSGGWGLKFDRVRERFDAHQVFVTLRRPGPTEITSQALVDQSVDTRARLTHNVEVYARTIKRDAEPGGYRLAGRADKR